MRRRRLIAASFALQIGIIVVLVFSSAAVAKTHRAAPVDMTPPTIGGVAVQAQTLGASPGSWKNSPTRYAYQWRRCMSSGCAGITGASSQSYVLQSTDVGDTIDVVV